MKQRQKLAFILIKTIMTDSIETELENMKQRFNTVISFCLSLNDDIRAIQQELQWKTPWDKQQQTSDEVSKSLDEFSKEVAQSMNNMLESLTQGLSNVNITGIDYKLTDNKMKLEGGNEVKFPDVGGEVLTKQLGTYTERRVFDLTFLLDTVSGHELYGGPKLFNYGTFTYIKRKLGGPNGITIGCVFEITLRDVPYYGYMYNSPTRDDEYTINLDEPIYDNDSTRTIEMQLFLNTSLHSWAKISVTEKAIHIELQKGPSDVNKLLDGDVIEGVYVYV